MDRTLTLPLLPQTFSYGEAFEHFVMTELVRLNSYYKKHFKFLYLRTQSDVEIDVVIYRPGLPDLLIEMKSSDRIDSSMCKSLDNIGADWDRYCEQQLWSRDQQSVLIGKTKCLHWIEGLKELFVS